MSDEILAPIIAAAILLALFMWVPTLDFCNARCQKLLRGRERRPVQLAEPVAEVGERQELRKTA